MWLQVSYFPVVNGSKMALWVARVAVDRRSIARIAFAFDAAVHHTGFISRPSLPSLNNAAFSAKSGSALVSCTRPSVFPPSHPIPSRSPLMNCFPGFHQCYYTVLIRATGQSRQKKRSGCRRVWAFLGSFAVHVKCVYIH